jgi:nicotinamide mononucleotide transporter
MTLNTLVEILATLSGLAYIIFLIRENVIAWPFGIAGSMLSIYLFIDGKLYSEAFLFGFYVIAGFWGWIRWSRRLAVDHNPVVRYRLLAHTVIILVASVVALTLATGFSNYTDAQRPYIDAFTTAFSFAATYMQVKKVLETWVYWIFLNIASIWLYIDRSLDIYAALICVYAVLSVWGLVQWLRIYRQQTSLS